MKLVSELFGQAESLYNREGRRVSPGTGWHVARNRYISCLVAVAWTLEARGYEVCYLHNDYLPCISIDHVYYDLNVPSGSTEVTKLKHGGSIDYRPSELFIVYETYLSGNYDGVDFVNAFSISNKGTIFPYGHYEVSS